VVLVPTVNYLATVSCDLLPSSNPARQMLSRYVKMENHGAESDPIYLNIPPRKKRSSNNYASRKTQFHQCRRRTRPTNSSIGPIAAFDGSDGIKLEIYRCSEGNMETSSTKFVSASRKALRFTTTVKFTDQKTPSTANMAAAAPQS
jgi:hypothetical protein